MAQKKAGNMKFVLSALTLCLVAQQSLYSGAHASMITGIAPEHGSNGNIYNIDPSVLNGDIGFRLYEEFQLDKGDIANLIFKYGEKNVEKFVNLVDNTININGIVNTMRDGNFYNGQAIFVSPNGMVVGASGVLNVGSLTVLTPDQNKFDQFKTDYEIRHDLADLYSQGTGKVTIDGKVIARDAVDIRAAAVNINNSIMSGVGNNTDVLTSHNQADILFNSLVNTDNMKAGNSFASDSGSIKITSYSGNDGVKLAEGSTLKNFGKGNIEITSHGSQGIVANGDIKNPDGNVILTTTKGSIDIAGDVQNRNGDISADSANGIYLAQSGSLKNENGNIKLKNKGTKGINIKGSIENKDGNLIMDNAGKEGIIIDGAPISNTNGDINVLNTGADGTEINGTITNTNGNSTYTNKAGELAVNGKVNNIGGNLKFDNTGSGISVSYGADITNQGGNLEILNTGADGILVDRGATVTNETGNTIVTNSGDGGTRINGTVENKNGNSTYTNEAGAITVAGNISNTEGNLDVTNRGEGGIAIEGTSSNTNGNSTYTNEAGGLTVDGSITNTKGDLLVQNNGKDGISINGLASNITGNSTYINKNGVLTVNGEVKNEGGNLKFDNTGSGISVNNGASVSNKDGNLEMLNTGVNGIFADEGSKITNDNGNMLVSNSGAGGMTLNGLASNTKGNAEFNNADGTLNVNGTISNNDKLLAIRNTGDGLNINEDAFIDSEGQLLIDNSGFNGMNISGTVNSLGDADIINSNGNLNINESADINHTSVANNYINISNTGNKLYIGGNVESENGKMNISNTGKGGLHIDKNANVTNNVVRDDNIPVFEKHTPEINISNDSEASMDIDGTVTANGSSYNIVNAGKGALNINETANINGNITKESNITNHGDGGLNIAGTITTDNGSTEGKYLDAGLTIKNDNEVSGIHITKSGKINSKNSNHTVISNNGAKGIVIDGEINQNFAGKNANSLKITNTGAGGINLSSTGRINNTSSTYVENSGKEGIKFAGLTKTNGLNVKNSNSNVVIGDDTKNDKYITSTGDVNIDVNNGSILNYGVNKTLINIQNSSALNMNAIDGTIGLDDGNCGAACIGVGPDSRDFTKSINVTSDGRITATTSQNALADDLVINIAGKNSDLNIDHVKADGKVLLTTADFDKDGKGYSILNASTDPTKANVEGKGIALIASDKIGEADNKLTFNQTEGKFNMEGYDLDNLTYQPNAQYGMDVLAINDVNIKGQDDKYDTNVCTMISREGSINAEFSGNTYIREVTADKDLNLVTRGAEFVIDNLGTVPYTPEDYFGPNGNNAPENVNIKALDINPNTRVDDAGLVDGVHSHWADSHLIIKNAKVDDNAKIVLTGDNVYAGGYRFYMGKDRNEDGKTYWVYDDRTEMTDMSGNDPTIRVNAVREDDVTSIGRQEEERNYYTGGSVQEDKPWYGDDDDDDDDHLIVPEPGDDDDDDEPDPPPPGDDDDDEPDPPPPGDDDDDEPDPPPPGDDDDDEPDPPPPGDDDDDEPDPPPPGDDDDDEPDPPPPGDDDDDEPDPPPPGDDDDDEPDPPPPGDDDDDEPDPPPPGDDDDDEPTPPPGDDDDDGDDEPTPPPSGDDDDQPATMDDAKRTWKKVVADDINIIDKRQYIRFRVDHNPNPVVFESIPTVSSLVDISRGGVALTHHKALKVGDVIPVHIKYGDLNIDADVKIVTASDVRAGGEFVDLDQTTANRLLYLNLMLEEDQKLTLGGNNQI